MNMIIVDDERHALQSLEHAVRSVGYDGRVSCFLFAEDALSYAGEHVVDIAFLDIELIEMDGVALAKCLQQLYPQVNIIFVTGHADHMKEAFAMYASGYVMKPVDPERVKEELDNLRYPIAERERNQGTYIQCFGNFEIFTEGKPIIFRRPKAKEILAYLVDRKGASVSRKELAAVLWEDSDYSRSIQSHLHILLSELTEVLTEAGIGDILIKDHSYYAVDTGKVTCDYYQYKGIKDSKSGKGTDEYMSNYSWAEFRKGEL